MTVLRVPTSPDSDHCCVHASEPLHIYVWGGRDPLRHVVHAPADTERCVGDTKRCVFETPTGTNQCVRNTCRSESVCWAHLLTRNGVFATPADTNQFVGNTYQHGAVCWEHLPTRSCVCWEHLLTRISVLRFPLLSPCGSLRSSQRALPTEKKTSMERLKSKVQRMFT